MAEFYKEKEEKINDKKALFIIADDLIGSTSGLLKRIKTEDELKIEFEKLLEPVCKELSINFETRYGRTIIKGRPDAVHGRVIIEYEAPKSFSSKRKIEHAYNQLINYLSEESKKADLNKLVGIGFDGEKMFFVKHRQGKWVKEPKEEAYLFNQETAKTFLIYLRSLYRLPLTAENLTQKFGPESETAKNAVLAFTNALRYWKNERIETFFNEWKRLFGIVYGEQFNGSKKSEEFDTLLKYYPVSPEINFHELLFSIHTYFAFLMKLIAIEILKLRETSLKSSFASYLTHLLDDELKQQVEDIENGGIYAKKGINNFLEGDFFAWYLDAFNYPALPEVIKEISRTLSEFEPATSTLDPDSTRDLLKKLYQYLVPKEVRHRLGEYYTPDWLAELLLNEVGYDGNTLKRFLDPACGSGTFLVLAIQRAIKHGREKEKMPDLEIAKRIVANIWGFDLNPLAVIASRTNYLFALGDLINEIINKGGNIEIPVYLADSVLWPEQVGGQGQFNFYGGDYVKVNTSIKEFHIPAVWLRDKGELMKIAAPLVEKFAKNDFEPEIAMEHFKNKGVLFPPNEKIIENFYKEILELEKQKKNGIWARFLKNAFAPMIAGKFDFVVGNPPWIRWDYLSKEYREATRHLWEKYGLFSLKGYAQMLGGAKPDFSMLFVYASSDYYLKDGAKLGFLITQEVFKSKGAGEGFRRFQLGEGKYLKVLKAHDLVSIQPFEGAANKTAAIILKKGEKTGYPVTYIIWSKKKGVGKIATDKLLDEVLPLLQKKKYNAKPIGSIVGPWRHQLAKLGDLSNIEGKNFYKARAGAWADPYGVFWLKVKKVLSDGKLLFSNLPERGRTKVKKIEDEKIESDLIYPAIQGPNIKRWGFNSDFFVLIVNDKNDPMKGYDESVMISKWPLTFAYLTQFRNELLERASYKKFHLKQGHPFYSQYNIGDYTFSRYKVVWKRMTTDIVATVVSEIKTLSEEKTSFGYKQVIPLDTTVFFPVDNESEAHYLCAIINSKPVRNFIKSFSSAGRGFGTPSVMEHVSIPKFDPKNPLHQKLAEISKKCHQLKSEGKEKEIAKLEKENDELVRRLFNIK
jgi:methylase of polypeptide subunit release factors